MLDAVAQVLAVRRLDRVTHGLDRRVADRVGGDLEARRGRAADELAQLVGCRAPDAAPAARRHALRASVDENLDRARANHAAAEAGPHAEIRRGLQKLPGQELVDAHAQPAVAGERLVGAQVVREATVDGGAHRRDAARHQQVLRLEDAFDPALQGGWRLHVGDQAHRRLEQQAVGRAVEVAADAAPVWVGSVGDDARGVQGGAVRNPRVAAALVDERRPVAGRPVELGPVRLATLGQLVGPVAHPLQPVAWFEPGGMVPQALDDVVDPARPRQVGGETGEAVVDDVRVGVVEPGEDGAAAQVDDSCPGTAEAHHLPAPACEDPSTRDRQVAPGGQTLSSQRADTPARQDQIRSRHRPLD